MTTNESILIEIRKEIEYHEAALTAWKAVELVKTKNGGEFKVFSKNFKNAEYKSKEFSFKGEKELKVSFRANNTWQDESIDNTEMVKYSKRKVDPERIIKIQYIEEFYYLTVAEMWQEVQKKIEYHINKIKVLEKNLSEVDSYIKQLDQEIKKIKEIVKNTDDIKNRGLYYKLLDYVNDSIRYR